MYVTKKTLKGEYLNKSKIQIYTQKLNIKHESLNC